MPAPNEGTTTTEGQAPPDGATETPPTTTGTGTTGDEVTLLRSRNSGLDAKVTSLTQAQKDADARAAAAEAKLAAYEAGKVSSDEALRAQLEAEQAKTAAAEKKASLALIKASYPEAFDELGDLAYGMDEAKLASLEARLKGVPDSEEPPTPRGSNGPRTAGSKNPPKEETSDDILARLGTMTPAWMK